ncbi:MAG TPA: helix-turn-helix domain-containing protein [Stellaceae bacterium]|nr:helix-turn-helix domain-containing protein [Stellaceae bacterium]
MYASLHQTARTRNSAPAGANEKSDGSLSRLDDFGIVVTLKRDEVLFYEGDRAGCYYKVVTGAIRSCKLLADGRRHIGDFFLPGDFIGLNALETHGFTAEAVADASLVRYERRDVEALIQRDPRIGKSLLGRLCSDLSEAQARMLLLGRMTAQERLASFLLRMAARGAGCSTNLVALPMTRTDIGDYLGLTTETVCRTLAQLKHSGLIAAPSPHEVRVLRREALSEMAEGA